MAVRSNRRSRHTCLRKASSTGSSGTIQTAHPTTHRARRTRDLQPYQNGPPLRSIPTIAHSHVFLHVGSMPHASRKVVRDMRNNTRYSVPTPRTRHAHTAGPGRPVTPARITRHLTAIGIAHTRVRYTLHRGSRKHGNMRSTKRSVGICGHNTCGAEESCGEVGESNRS